MLVVLCPPKHMPLPCFLCHSLSPTCVPLMHHCLFLLLPYTPTVPPTSALAAVAVYPVASSSLLSSHSTAVLVVWGTIIISTHSNPSDPVTLLLQLWGGSYGCSGSAMVCHDRPHSIGMLWAVGVIGVESGVAWWVVQGSVRCVGAVVAAPHHLLVRMLGTCLACTGSSFVVTIMTASSALG